MTEQQHGNHAYKCYFRVFPVLIGSHQKWTDNVQTKGLWAGTVYNLTICWAQGPRIPRASSFGINNPKSERKLSLGTCVCVCVCVCVCSGVGSGLCNQYLLASSATDSISHFSFLDILYKCQICSSLIYFFLQILTLTFSFDDGVLFAVQKLKIA